MVTDPSKDMVRKHGYQSRPETRITAIRAKKAAIAVRKTMVSMPMVILCHGAGQGPRPMARLGQMMAERRRTMAEVLAIISLASGVIVILLAVIATRIANIVAASKALSK